MIVSVIELARDPYWENIGEVLFHKLAKKNKTSGRFVIYVSDTLVYYN